MGNLNTAIEMPFHDVRWGELLERLRELARRVEPTQCMRVHAKKSYVLKAVDFDTGLIAIPLQGNKRVRLSHGWIEATVGSLFIVPNACSADIANIPDRPGGAYVAIGIPLQAHVIGAARQLLREPVSDVRGNLAFVNVDDHVADLTAWLNARDAGDLPRACYSIVSIVLRLYAQGHQGLMYSAPPTLGARIRQMIAAGPAREWSSAEIEVHLGMSGASLRRHLAAEGASLRDIIADARLSHAMVLLTTTRLSVKVVAQRVGYASASAFSRRFSDRYGVDPSRVGND